MATPPQEKIMEESVEHSSLELQLDQEEAESALRELAHLISINEVDTLTVEIETSGMLVLDDYTRQLLDSKRGVVRKDGEVSEVVNFEEGSDASLLASRIYDNGNNWHTTKEIKHEMAEDTDVEKDRISQVLWDLSQRGVLEKRDCESDRRMKEYRITELGKQSVEISRKAK